MVAALNLFTASADEWAGKSAVLPGHGRPRALVPRLSEVRDMHRQCVDGSVRRAVALKGAGKFHLQEYFSYNIRHCIGKASYSALFMRFVSYYAFSIFMHRLYSSSVPLRRGPLQQGRGELPRL